MNRADFVYSLGEEHTKARLSSNGTSRPQESWKTIALFSSEQSLVEMNENQNLGLAIRLLTFSDLTFTASREMADEIQQFAFANHGILGQVFVEALLEEEPGSVQEEYNHLRAELMEQLLPDYCSLTERLCNHYTLLLQAAHRLNALGVKINKQEIIDLIVHNHKTISNSSNMGANAIIAIFNHIARNPSQPGVRVVTAGKCLAVVETLVYEILHKAGFQDTKLVMKLLDEQGYIIRQQKCRIKSKLRMGERGSASCYCYQFDLTKVETVFGDAEEAPDPFSDPEEMEYCFAPGEACTEEEPNETETIKVSEADSFPAEAGEAWATLL